jgi:tetratricopeptide (TPR) repeat protein
MKSLLPELPSGLFPGRLSSNKEWANYCYNLLQAEIFLAEGSPEKAISVFEKVSPVVPPALQWIDLITGYNLPFLKDVLARAYVQKGDRDRAIAEYERLTTFDPKSKGRYLAHPRYHYRLAKLYEQKGWKGKAMEHYEKFLDLWKDADPGITEVEDAKKRLAGLKT